MFLLEDKSLKFGSVFCSSLSALIITVALAGCTSCSGMPCFARFLAHAHIRTTIVTTCAKNTQTIYYVAPVATEPASHALHSDRYIYILL